MVVGDDNAENAAEIAAEIREKADLAANVEAQTAFPPSDDDRRHAT